MKFLNILLFASISLGYIVPRVDAQTVDLDKLCQSFPLNSRCEDYTPQGVQDIDAFERSFQGIQVTLNTNGSDDEMVILEIGDAIVGDITLSAYHLERSEDDGFFNFNNLLDGTIGVLSPVPIPFDLFQAIRSQASQTEYIAFTPDSCTEQVPLVNGRGFQLPECSIVGNNTLSLSREVDIRSGFFTLGYVEGNLLQAIIFRIDEHDAEFVRALETDNLCQSFPLNSRCRYWPLQ